ncbi:coadhesin-like isoform X1 [Pomacea canaliculata]|uniref:coadhesin-like isoform X1 n=1 Tax=Pomacea canaliculata TaxID=400727 RepID=UPI000D727D6D|nr:coadhesin-like isoform X1 [Pomacea canaliculata]
MWILELVALHSIQGCGGHLLQNRRQWRVVQLVNLWHRKLLCDLWHGTRLRSFVRQCNNPAPSYCGATCPGASTKSEYESCNAGCCPVSGGWSSWQLQSVSSCPVTCGGSTQSVTYQRFCNNPPPSCGGATCAGSSTNVVQQTCNTQSCPVHGGWSSWSVDNNGRCSVTCGPGTMSVWYRRHCNSPAPQYGGRNCTGDVTKVESASCSPQPCPVNGGWSTWTLENNSSCSVTCGAGEMSVTHTRDCTNPAPQYGGSNCTGDNTRVESVACNTQPCPVDGGCSPWYLDSNGSCSQPCGGGEQNQSYTRNCTSPAPQYGGSNCTGDNTRVETVACNTQPCPVDGGWSPWYLDNNGSCSHPCGGGEQNQSYTRNCTSPAPQYGGSNCTGDNTRVETVACSTQPCPVDGGWSPWYLDSNGSCSQPCGGGEQNQSYTRNCTSPAPQYGGSNCTGDNTRVETVACNTQPCPVYGGWSPWYLDNNGSCSQPCGGGEQNQSYTRNCTSPAPQYGGSNCTGDNTRVETVACNTQPCPVDGGWSPWYLDSNGSCSQPCGGGQQNQSYTRNCTSPAPLYGGGDCQGDDSKTESVPCNTDPCPIDGGWSNWSKWREVGQCSALCGGGQVLQLRKRKCDNPQPAYGGSECEGAAQENKTVVCNNQDCGAQCPEGSTKFIPDTNNSRNYYQCDNGVARLMRCGVGSVWDELTNTCTHDGSQQKTECDPSRVYQPHASDCSKFIMCVQGRAYTMSCPNDLRYSDAISSCTFASDVSC